ncbi:hypothetical protein B6N60_04368 [Richelia sinica FACHB-800]|uniref:Uncharacterized protein n=1 Tax=Richelia sinica FACHB-800 TaxID=1357546 RepID=A0A975Y6U3_9NOST|nr:hypothetical protein B6N60_04368 [Richelia sinica FACHB-800]
MSDRTSLHPHQAIVYGLGTFPASSPAIRLLNFDKN